VPLSETNSPPAPAETHARQRRLSRLIVPTALLLIYAVQCFWFIRTQSLTVDEPGHIAAGLAMWRHGRFVMLNDQPPLARLIFTAPLAAFTSTQVDNIHERLFATDPALALWTRPPIVLLGILLGIFLWLAAREWLSESAANFVLALFTFSPALIAHFSLATMDGAATLTIFLVVLQLARWRKNPTTWQTVLLGVALGLMLTSKFYAPPLVLVALYIVTLKTTDGSKHSRKWHWKHAVAVAALAWVVVWAGYFFHVSVARFEDHELVIHMPHRENDFRVPVNFHLPGKVPIPGAEYIDGIRLSDLLLAAAGDTHFLDGMLWYHGAESLDKENVLQCDAFEHRAKQRSRRIVPAQSYPTPTQGRPRRRHPTTEMGNEEGQPLIAARVAPKGAQFVQRMALRAEFAAKPFQVLAATVNIRVGMPQMRQGRSLHGARQSRGSRRSLFAR